MAKQTMVLTGATGFLGRHFVHEVLRESEGTWVCAIARGEDAHRARERVVRGILDVAHSEGSRLPDSAFDRLEVLCGDVVQPHCGLDEQTRRALRMRQVGSFWHFAATTEFDEQRRSFIEQQNVDGTAHALSLAEEVSAARFVHLSTSYCCGKREGQIAEVLHDEGEFHNPYERSKLRSERMVMERCASARMDARILRPSIVVGSLRTHEPHHAEHAFYRFLRGIFGMRHLLRQADAPLRVRARGDAPLNLVPVDTLTRDCYQLLANDFPKGPIYHLTSSHCPSVREALDAVCDAAGVPRFRLLDGPVQDPNPSERMLASGMSLYASYLCEDKSFARAHGEPPALTAQDARLWCERWIASHRQRHALADSIDSRSQVGS